MDCARLQPTIRAIIAGIPNGHLFDSHEVIRQLLRKHSDDYFRFIASFGQETPTTEIMHGHIGQIIDSLEGEVVQQGKAWSENIHGTPSECTCFMKQ